MLNEGTYKNLQVWLEGQMVSDGGGIRLDLEHGERSGTKKQRVPGHARLRKCNGPRLQLPEVCGSFRRRRQNSVLQR